METKIYVLPKHGGCGALTGMSCRDRNGDLPVLSKTESAEVMFRYIDQARDLQDGETLVVELADGRLLRYFHTVVGGDPELREWAVHLYTLRQRTPKCLVRFHERQAWFYLAPFQGEGYKTRGDWVYSVWR